jgi:hypothetical protein
LSFPLLHAAGSVRAVYDVDPLAIAGGAALFVAATAWAWAPRDGFLVRARTLRRFGRAIAVTLVVAALLPSLFPYDHLLQRDAHASEHGPVHALHCHDTPGSCADAPLPAGPGELFAAAPLLTTPALISVAMAVAVVVLCGVTKRPPVPPPVQSSLQQ